MPKPPSDRKKTKTKEAPAKSTRAPKLGAKIPFPKKNLPPKVGEFAARLPLALGKKLEACRTFLLKQKAVSEDVYFYGPKSGWALRYLCSGRPLCSLFVHDNRPVAIVSLDPAQATNLDWKALSPVAQRARRDAHGSPSLLWLDIPLEGTGEKDAKAIVKVKLETIRRNTPPPLPPPPARG